MAVNVPEVLVLDDQDHYVTVKVIGFYNAATNANSVIVTANTLRGANTSLPCILSLTAATYTSSMNNGFLAIEYVSSVNANSKAITMGRFNDGIFNQYIPNSANTPTGDINLLQQSLGSADAFTLVLTFVKEFQGTYWASPSRGAGAWANTQVGY
jgi:hypothetical protein